MKHCWEHRTSFQHATPNHEDVVCCWCGEMRCRSYEPIAREGHGPLAPKNYRLRTSPRDEEECNARPA